MFEKLRKILNKEDFNYSTGYVNPIEFHSIVFFLIRSYGVLDEFVPTWSGILQVFMICCPMPALGICSLGIFHGWQILDATVIIETGTYAIVLMYKLWILSCVKLNMADFHAFMRILRADFKYVCLNGNKYRKRFFENQLQTWKICILVITIMLILCVGMAATAIFSLIYYLINHNPESDGERPLFFPFWMFEVDFTKSPMYEIALVYSEICVIAYGYNYIFMIGTHILWIREIATKADLVIWGMQDLMVNIRPAQSLQEAEIFSKMIKQRMRIIVQEHHSMYELMDHYSRVFKKLLIFEQLFCGPVVCLTMFSVTKKLEDGEINYILIILCASSVIVAFGPSYLCTFLRIKVSSVLDACWDTPFWNAGPVIRPYLVLITQRSLRPLPLKFGGFQEVSVQTFANKMTSAYSCFNMLRQVFK